MILLIHLSICSLYCHLFCNLASSNTKSIEIDLYLLNLKKLINMSKSTFTKNEISLVFVEMEYLNHQLQFVVRKK